MFGFFNDKLFIVKCLMKKIGVVFVFMIVMAGMFFFSTLIIFSEIGYLLAINQADFGSVAEFEAEVINREILTGYYNSFWNMIITFTTIGYGDMYVRVTMSRVILLFVCAFGSVIFASFVSVLTNLFENDA